VRKIRRSPASVIGCPAVGPPQRLPVSRTGRTAPSRKSWSDFLRISAIACLLKAM